MDKKKITVEEIFLSDPIKDDTPLFVGLCNKCKNIEMVNTGNGIDEPLDPVPMCIKLNFEVMPVPKGEEVTECEFHEPYT